jgi:2',3'-cyclic-nucleotide 2'-phosphodiesterase (5'-nucleotidase family)
MTLSLIGTNDLHGGILPADDVGGLALFGGYVKNLRAARARDGGAVLLVDAGDMFQGTLESNLIEGASVIAAYNALGYAAAAIGNHEFDFGPVGPEPRNPAADPRGALKARAAEARFPFVSANLADAASGRVVDWPNVKPSTLVDVNGVKVGIVGVLTAAALSATAPINTVGLRVLPLAPAIEQQAARLRTQGATIIIVAAHAGGSCTNFDDPGNLASCNQASEIVTLARALPHGLVDAIVAGHVHERMAHRVEGIPVIESGSRGRSFGRIDFTVARASGRPTAARIFAPRDLCAFESAAGRCATRRSGSPARYEGAVVEPDAAIANVIAPAVQQVSALKTRPLGVTLDTAIRRGEGDSSPLGNLVTDAMRAAVPNADAALNNSRGGLRADLRRGPLTYGSLYEVIPFDNTIATLPLTGRDLRRVAITQLTRNQRLVGISGFTVDAACRGRTLDVTLTRTSGRVIEDNDRLTVVTSDYLAQGGARILTPILPPDGFAYEDAPLLQREAVAAWLTRRGGRLRDSDFADARPRWTYPGGLPVRCPQ